MCSASALTYVRGISFVACDPEVSFMWPLPGTSTNHVALSPVPKMKEKCECIQHVEETHVTVSSRNEPLLKLSLTFTIRSYTSPSLAGRQGWELPMSPEGCNSSTLANGPWHFWPTSKVTSFLKNHKYLFFGAGRYDLIDDVHLHFRNKVTRLNIK